MTSTGAVFSCRFFLHHLQSGLKTLDLSFCDRMRGLPEGLSALNKSIVLVRQRNVRVLHLAGHRSTTAVQQSSLHAAPTPTSSYLSIVCREGYGGRAMEMARKTEMSALLF